MNLISKKLHSISLRGNSLNGSTHIEEMISIEQSFKKFDFLKRVAVLEDVKRRVKNSNKVDEVFVRLREDMQRLDQQMMAKFEQEMSLRQNST